LCRVEPENLERRHDAPDRRDDEQKSDARDARDERGGSWLSTPQSIPRASSACATGHARTIPAAAPIAARPMPASRMTPPVRPANRATASHLQLPSDSAPLRQV
jgi:hypothetical protein